MIAILKTHAKRAAALALLVPMLAACSGAGTATAPTSGAASGGSTAETSAPATAATSAPAATAMMDATMAPEATMEMEATTEATSAATSAAGTSATSAAGGAAVTLPEVDPATVTGNFVAAGSSTVYPLAERMLERFTEDGYAGNPTIDSIGSGAGIERFCNNETDIATASRAIEEEEITTCTAAGLEPLEFRVGTDALTIVMSSENDFVTDLTLAQLNQIFSGKAATWDQVDPSFPAEAIQLFSPGSDSGTFDYFVEVVFAEEMDADEDAAAALILNAPGIQLSENDNVLVQGVEGSPYAIGYFGYAYYSANQGALKAISVDGVEPNEETAESGDYPISRPLFMYSAASKLEANPAAAAFLNYVLTNVNDEIVDVGYFPASEEALNTARENLMQGMGN